MKRKAQFCCDASRDIYKDYYAKQSGGAMPVFVGSKHQRGHGIGSMPSGLFRNVVLPFLKGNVGSLAGSVLKTGAQVLDDVVQGKSLNDTVKSEYPKR